MIMFKKKYFSGIEDIPLQNWWKIKAGEYQYCRMNLDDGDKRSDLKAYIRINDTYILEFGLGADMERVMELRKQITILQCDYVIEGKEFLRNEIRKLQAELMSIISESGGMDQESVLIVLEKWRGIEIDEKKITARKYYKIIKFFEDEQLQMKKQQA